MAENLAIYTSFILEKTDGGKVRPQKFDRLVAPVILSVDGKVFHRQLTVAAAAKQELFLAGTDQADFDFLWITSDKDDVIIELVCDDDNSVGQVASTIYLKAGHPFSLASKKALANYTYNFAAGAADVIDRIRCRNDNAATATIELFAIT